MEKRALETFMTPLQLHIENWKNCTKCEYSKTRNRVVLGKGKIPCDLLFCGESPGVSENMLGLPFIGKAGKILDRIVNKVFGSEADRRYRIAYTNLIGCIPLVKGELHEKEEPEDNCIMACKPRLEDFIRVCNPRLIVAVGKLSNEWLDQTYKHCVKVKNVPIVTIQHSASILRMPPPAQPLAEHRCGVIISSAVTEHLEKE